MQLSFTVAGSSCCGVPGGADPAVPGRDANRHSPESGVPVRRSFRPPGSNTLHPVCVLQESLTVYGYVSQKEVDFM